jgi:hypothetical protein
LLCSRAASDCSTPSHPHPSAIWEYPKLFGMWHLLAGMPLKSFWRWVGLIE